MAQGAAQIYGKNLVKIANRETKAQIRSARKPILADQAAARAALQGYGLAAGKLLSGIGPADQQAYSQAAQDQAGLASGFAGQAADQVRQAQQAGDQFQQQQAHGAASQEQVNPNDIQNAVYDQAGYIPGSSLESQGAAAGAWGNALPAIQTARTEGDLQASDAGYAKQLLAIAAQEPALRQQILSALYKDSLSGQAQQLVNAKFGEQVRVDNAHIARDNALTHQGQVRLNIEGQSLVLRQQSQKLAVQKYLRQGNTIDSSASRAAGYLVDGAGNPITTPNGKKIPYKTYTRGSSGGGGKSGGATTTQLREAQQYAAKNFGRGNGDPPSVDNPLAPVVPFRKAQNYLVTYYGLSKSQARRILVQLGRKPDGQRPQK